MGKIINQPMKGNCAKRTNIILLFNVMYQAENGWVEDMRSIERSLLRIFVNAIKQFECIGGVCYFI